MYVATELDSVFAFDADRPGPPLWQDTFTDPPDITAVPSTDVLTTDIMPWVGITATPVIDPLTSTLYVLTKVKLVETTTYQQQLHALDIATGLERQNSPVTISATVAGTGDGSIEGEISFDPLKQNDRAALTLANGVVYLTYASHGDNGPYHGWILGYDETSLERVVVYNDSPNGSDAGIWQSGCGPGVDTNGDLIAITGNGTFETSQPRVDYGDSFLRLAPDLANDTLTVSTFFTPSNELTLSEQDQDLGSGGNLMLPDQPGTNPHLMLSSGKQGTMYLVNRDAMGGFNSESDQVVQELPGEIGGLYGTPAYWAGLVAGTMHNMVYVIGDGTPPEMFFVSRGRLVTPAASTASEFVFGFPPPSPVISANGTRGGIMWIIDSTKYGPPGPPSGPAVLHAFAATNLTDELYDSSQSPSDNPGDAVKFTIPTVANGKVYMGTQTQLAAFGLMPSPTPTPTATATASATPTGTPTPTPSDTPTPVAATIDVYPKFISFPNEAFADSGATSTPVKVTVTNRSQNNSVFFSEPTISDGYIVTSNGCVGGLGSGELGPGKTCDINVAYAPTALGIQHGKLLINTNATRGRRAVKLKGKGIAPRLKIKPRSLSFGRVQAGATSPAQDVTLTNLSAVSITLTVAPAATPPYNVSANTCSTLAANGGTCTISVEFDPGSSGEFNGRLRIRDNAAKNPQHVDLLGIAK